MAQYRSTTEIARLPLSIWPAEIFPLEPVQGWIHRAAERNYALSAAAFVDSLGLSGRDWDYDELLNLVRQLPIEDYAELEASTPKRCDEGYEIRGHKVPYRLISKNGRRVCPVCLEERRYVRIWFDFVPIASCPHHDVALMEGLPDDPLDWRRPEIGWTQSGTKIRAEHATVQIASKLDHYIVKLMTGEPVGLPDHLHGMSLNTILTTSICVGMLYRGDEKHTPTHENLRNLCQSGFEPILEGSHGILEFLCGADWLQPGYSGARYKARCNGVPQMLLAISDERLRDLIADSFARVRVRNRLTAPSGRLSKYDGEDGLLNLQSAARQLGLSAHSLRGLLQKLGMETTRSERGRALRLTQGQFHSLQNYITATLGSEEAAKKLGCKPEDLKSLDARRLLRPAFRMSGRDHYTKSDLSAFVDKIISASAEDSSLDGQLITLYSGEAGISLAEASSRIIRDKSVLVINSEPHTPLFESLRVADASIASGQGSSDITHARIRAKAQVRDVVTFAKAAARLGTGYAGIKALIDASFIALTKNAWNKERICEKSLEEFESRYIKASAYAPALNCHPTYAPILLRKMGVTPINDKQGVKIKFVDYVEVQRLTGLVRPVTICGGGWHTIELALAEALSTNWVPATTRTLGLPAIEVRATSGRWSFLVKQEHDDGPYILMTSFTSRRQPARLKKIQHASIDPSDIWPGATVHPADKGGFVIVDETLRSEQDGFNVDALVERAITRSCQLHRVL